MSLGSGHNQKSDLNTQNHLSIETSASGKAILLGEHAVLYGCDALAIPLQNVQMRVSAKKNLMKNRHSSFHIGNNQLSRHAMGVLKDGFSALKIGEFSVQIQGKSDIKMGSGLGSSAALSIVTLKALNMLEGCKELTPEQLATMGRRLEARFHGSSSGLDPSVVAYNQPLLYSIQSGAKTVRIKQPPKGAWSFALVDSEVASSTSHMVQQAKPFFVETPDRLTRLNKFKEAVARGLKSLNTGKVEMMVEAFDTNHQLLREIGVVSEALLSLSNQIKSLGALASKTTGAGGGGFIIAILPPKQPEKVLTNLYREFGASRVLKVSI